MKQYHKWTGLWMNIVLNAIFASTMHQTQTQLKQVKEQITVLHQKLSHDQAQQSSIEIQLIKTDKKIGSIVHQLSLISRVIQAKNLYLNKLLLEIKTLTKTLGSYQTLLAQHMRATYIFYHPWSKNIWLVQEPQTLHRWIMQYQYIVKANMALIDDVIAKKQLLDQKERVLKQELDIQARLKKTLVNEHTVLEHLQTKQSQLATHLKATIQSNRQRLSDYQHNEKALHQLLEKLLVEHTVTVVPRRSTAYSSPFRKSPTTSIKKLGKPWHQGLIFAASAGSSVYAVKAGKVVFSDWLRGYGLLIILDHGQGWMSLYGYNQSLFKHRGEWVEKGEQIATVGSSGGRSENGLYFAVRHFGKVVAANSWLKHSIILS